MYYFDISDVFILKPYCLLKLGIPHKYNCEIESWRSLHICPLSTVMAIYRLWHLERCNLSSLLTVSQICTNLQITTNSLLYIPLGTRVSFSTSSNSFMWKVIHISIHYIYLYACNSFNYVSNYFKYISNQSITHVKNTHMYTYITVYQSL